MRGEKMWYAEETCVLDDFISEISDKTAVAQVKYAETIEQKVPVYNSVELRAQLKDPAFEHQIMAELASVLRDGAGVFVLKQAYTDFTVIDQATGIFNEIIEDERGKIGGEDHFAKAGANDRIWNALEKLCLRAPTIFANYYANDMVALASRSWLGPAYQMTSQVNVVRPGGEAQEPHCDYHLGFLTADEAARYPAHVHQLSPALTLQGGIAHCDMPVESGPTKIFPFSQNYGAGYMAWRREDFKTYFEEHHAQVPLAKGDALFFNPSLFHAAGANVTQDIARMANLLQVSSAFGQAMERIDRPQMSALLYPALLEAKKSNRLTEAEIINAVASCADGYAFPISLDETPPVGGLAPKSAQALMLDALQENLTPDQFTASVGA